MFRKGRAPEPSGITDQLTRGWANELIRWLSTSEDESIEVTAGNNIALSVTPNGSIEINALAGGGGLVSSDVCAMLSAYLTSNYASSMYLTKASNLYNDRVFYTYMATATTEAVCALPYDIPGFSTTLTAGKKYCVEINLRAFAASVPDIGFTLTKTANSTTGHWGPVGPIQALTSLNTGIGFTITGSTFYGFNFFGYLEVSTISATDVNFTFNQLLSTAATPVKVLPGSMIRIYKDS